MKHKQLSITLTKMHWLLGRKSNSKLSTNNKILVYRTIFKPVWIYGIQLWGTTSTSNIEILEHFQSKTLRIITDVPLYVPNETIQKDLQIPTVKEEISHHSTQYSKRLSTHPNKLTLNLLRKRLFQRHLPTSSS
jgi:hypothetical protein